MMMATKNTTVLTMSIIATSRDFIPTIPDNNKCREIGRNANSTTMPIF
jgi:hypothetical protein